METKIINEMSSNLITIQKNESLETAYRTMVVNRIRHLAVLNEYNEVAGIISDRDVQRGMTSLVTDLFGMRVEDLKFRADSKVNDYMTWPPKMISPESDLVEAAQLMLNEKISSVLVSNGKKVDGILTSEDLLRVLVALLNQKDGKSFRVSDFFSKEFIGRIGQFASDAGI
jgi:acetoin utilization protein AcuB